MCLYAGNSCAPKAIRNALSQSKTAICENSIFMIAWISSSPDWENEEEVDKKENDVDITELKLPIMAQEKRFG